MDSPHSAAPGRFLRLRPACPAATGVPAQRTCRSMRMVRIPRLDLGAPALIDTFATPRRHEHLPTATIRGWAYSSPNRKLLAVHSPARPVGLSRVAPQEYRDRLEEVRGTQRDGAPPSAVSIASHRSSRLPPRPPSGAMHDTGSPLAFSGGRTRAAAFPQAVPHDGTDRSGLGVWNQGATKLLAQVDGLGIVWVARQVLDIMEAPPVNEARNLHAPG